MAFEPPAGSRTVAIVGGGFSGSLLALKLVATRPDWRVTLIEPGDRPGRGLAYGACAPSHLLNVPVSRMETGLTPRFVDWLTAHGGMDEALAESGGDLTAAFAPREFLGQYLAERVAEARAAGALTVLRGEAVRMLDAPRRGLVLLDGREVEADTVVLATGNLPPRPPLPADHWLRDEPAFVVDPWARGALEGLDPDAPVLLLGTGLTMVDIALKLAADGHRRHLVELDAGPAPPVPSPPAATLGRPPPPHGSAHRRPHPRPDRQRSADRSRRPPARLAQGRRSARSNADAPRRRRARDHRRRADHQLHRPAQRLAGAGGPAVRGSGAQGPDRSGRARAGPGNRRLRGAGRTRRGLDLALCAGPADPAGMVGDHRRARDHCPGRRPRPHPGPGRAWR